MFESLFLNVDKRLISGMWSIAGDFGVIDADTPISYQEEQNLKTAVSEKNGITVSARLEKDENGLITRKDVLKNGTGHPITLRRFFARFSFAGCDFKVYTQANTWCNENRGMWQTLNTQISAENTGTRSCDDAAPILALQNMQNRRVTCFHLAPSCLWKMTAKILLLSMEKTATVVEAGLQDSNLSLTILPGQSVSLPAIYITEGTNTVDMDAWKLHRAMNRAYPRKTIPVIYNSWFSNFDRIRFDNLVEQAKIAAGLGFEYFVIDAGWFGNGDNWGVSVGDWKENMTGAFAGRLRDFSDYVHALGMKFGLWMEPERANEKSESVRNHPDYYLDNCWGNKLLDFSNPEASAYIFKMTCELVEKYNIDYFKFDYNATEPFDKNDSAFLPYYEGQKNYYLAVRKKYPNLYLTFCASGGYRIDLANLQVADSLWISDNQGPEEGIRIYRDLIKRMPPASIEKWNVQSISGPIPVSGMEVPQNFIISCNDAQWKAIVRVEDEYALHFLEGGPMGFTCDLTVFPAYYRRKVKSFIRDFKRNRSYYANAEARVLCEGPELTVLQFSDPLQKDIRVQLFCRNPRQNELTVFPTLNPKLYYSLNGECKSGKELTENGITFPSVEIYSYSGLRLTGTQKPPKHSK